ncbi:MAG: aminotransferase class III-fold pyridoxal phosphate-dependent enzyme [Steroidobacteraceae bacterium]
MTTDQSLLERRNRAFGRGATLFYSEPLQIVRGEGAFLFDAQGRRYVDLYNNVPCVGHANPRVVEAMSRAQATLNVHSRYLHEDIVRFAERYLALHDEAIQNVVFSCSGTEANEIALQVARAATGKRGILCCEGAYHGNSTLVSQLTEVDPDQSANAEVRSFALPDLYRVPEAAGNRSAEEYYWQRTESAIVALEQGGGIAAMLVCSILANEGTPRMPEGFLRKVAERVRRAGGLVIADEVQAGYGRTGRWWGYEVAGIRPDIVVTGKPMGNGLPLAATAASAELIERFRSRSRYFNTCASSPLQAAAGLAVLDEIQSRGLVEHVATVGSMLQAELRSREGRWPMMGEVRGHGLFINIEIVKDREGRAPDRDAAARIVDALAQEGFLTGTNGALGNQVKVRPPLVLEESEARAFLAAFDKVMDRAQPLRA